MQAPRPVDLALEARWTLPIQPAATLTGHTDPLGTDAYNQKLSERRADAVRDYLVSKGVPKDKIETLGMGKTQPVPGVTCNQKNMKELIACLQPNRRVEVEVVGTRPVRR